MDKFFAAEIDRKIHVIDLHDCFSKAEALDKLERELFWLQKQNAAYCRVVYGIGEGILRSAVLKELGHHPLVDAIKEDAPGSCIAVF